MTNKNTYITYENDRVQRITIHRNTCGHLHKNVGVYGEYYEFETFQEAISYAQSTFFPTIRYCSFCKPNESVMLSRTVPKENQMTAWERGVKAVSERDNEKARFHLNRSVEKGEAEKFTSVEEYIRSLNANKENLNNVEEVFPNPFTTDAILQALKLDEIRNEPRYFFSEKRIKNVDTIRRKGIPKNITRDAILQALAHLDAHGYDSKFESRKFDLIMDGRRYPPKHVIKVANELIGNEPLTSEDFEGGSQTNHFLQKLGFEIIEK